MIEKTVNRIRIAAASVLMLLSAASACFADEVWEPGPVDMARNNPWLVILVIAVIIIAAALLAAAKKKKKNRKVQ